jgi:hypothetical protein
MKGLEVPGSEVHRFKTYDRFLGNTLKNKNIG